MANKIYGGVNGAGARQITSLYGGSNSGAQRITKLYGSMNSQTKLVHQGFGHIDYGYGAVIYYTDSSHTSTASIVLETSSSVFKLSGVTHQTRLTWDATIEGITISNKDIYGVLLTEKVTTLPSYFLSGCDALNSSIILPKTLTVINDSGEQTAGSAFLFGCKNMTSIVDVGNLDPSVVKSITYYSFAANDSTAPAYTQGIKIAGANRAAWLTAFPNRAAPSYRKLVDAGY